MQRSKTKRRANKQNLVRKVIIKMQAETAYNVIQALTDKERQRLFAMLGIAVKDKKEKEKKASPVMSKEEFYEATLHFMNTKRLKKYGYKLTAV